MQLVISSKSSQLSIIRLFGEDGNELGAVGDAWKDGENDSKTDAQVSQRLFHWAHWEFEFTAEDEEESTGEGENEQRTAETGEEG